VKPTELTLEWPECYKHFEFYISLLSVSPEERFVSSYNAGE